ncbi:MAG TPA: YbhB/YbcL family Raf kinase inhibitor-like protein [Thermoanaerobaculia bacterium]|jgi:Raf kinase inhibitor-like YbhB/YbcL family protein
MPRIRIALALLLALACSRPAEHTATTDTAAPTGTPHGMMLASPAFPNNGAIPAKYTCDGANVSPPLTISATPAGTKSLAITVDDPDAPGGSFTHWLVWNIPASTATIAEGQHIGTEETNGFGKTGYGGPCPPNGLHHYVFTLYAMADAAPPSKGKVVAQTQLIGTYKK